jgi:outer membrane protein assembly factor BamD (BamD/ComL family)
VSWGRKDEAVGALKRLISEFPNSRTSERARRVLAYLETPS